jgi:16S rRNA processing protein RimM
VSEPSLEAGRVGRPHGLDGSFHVTRADARLLGDRDELLLDGRPVKVERRAGTPEKPILRLAGHEGREAAEALRGAQLSVPAEAAPALEAGEFWAHELAGCTVVDGDRAVGEVRRMLPLPSCEALEVARADGGPDLLVPMVRDAIRSVDVAARRIDVDLAFLGDAGG